MNPMQDTKEHSERFPEFFQMSANPLFPCRRNTYTGLTYSFMRVYSSHRCCASCGSTETVSFPPGLGVT